MQHARVLVTGASGDIGRAIASELLRAGAEVLMLGRSLENLTAFTPPACQHAPKYLAVDLTDFQAVAAMAVTIADTGALNALVLSSGIYMRSQDPHALRSQIDANVVGPYALLQATLPMLIEMMGQVIFISSSQALRGTAGVGQFAATMHAMKAVADTLRDEVNERGVKVSTIYLGRTAGERQRQIFEIEGRPYRPESLIQPLDVAQMVRHVLQMPRSVEVTDITMRPMRQS